MWARCDRGTARGAELRKIQCQRMSQQARCCRSFRVNSTKLSCCERSVCAGNIDKYTLTYAHTHYTHIHKHIPSCCKKSVCSEKSSRTHANTRTACYKRSVACAGEQGDAHAGQIQTHALIYTYIYIRARTHTGEQGDAGANQIQAGAGRHGGRIWR